jgi:hypothetical protein
MKQGRYKVKQARREWNRLANADHKIMYPGEFTDACRSAHVSAGKRCIESADGKPHTIWF